MNNEQPKCNNCGNPVLEETATCPNCSPVRRKRETAPAILVILVLCSSLLMLGTSLVNVTAVPTVKREEEKVPADLSFAAYAAAKQFIVERNPKATNFSEFNRSPVEQNGNRFTVMLATDDLSSPGNPVRNFFNVEMEYQFGSWKLIAVKQ